MDRLTNWTRGINTTTVVPVASQSCVSNSTSAFLDKLLVTTPSWVSVNQELRWIFLLHTYGFACLFFVLGFYTFFSILNLRSLITSRPFMSTINIFLCVLGASRAACLFIDPYNLKEITPKIIGSVMWDIGFPCVTSAFCLIQLAFLQLTQLKFGPEKIQKESCLSLVITAHFFFVIASDVALTSYNYYMAKYVVQVVFLVWSILVYLTFLRAGYKVMNVLQTMPSSMLTRDNFNAHHKGIMQLAMLAPYSNLATSVAAALVPTLLSPKMKGPEGNESTNQDKDKDKDVESSKESSSNAKQQEQTHKGNTESVIIVPKPLSPLHEHSPSQPVSTVPEVYVRPPTPTPTPTPSTAILPIITVSTPSRRSSLASRRGSDASRSSRRNSECSVKFVNEEDLSPVSESKRSIECSPKHSPDVERSRSPESISRSSQFATKLRRNSDFGNRTPRRMMPDEHHRLPKVLDISPAGSRRNSDIGGFMPPHKPESRRNSDISTRRNSELAHIKPLVINRRSSELSIRTLDKSPTHYHTIVPDKSEVQEKSESDSDQPDCSEKAALMNDKPKDKEDETKGRKKNLSWKNDKNKENTEDITAETNLLPENVAADGRVLSTDFTLHSILNHIAYVNRAKSDTPLHIPEASTAAARRSQIRRVLNVTYATAILGIMLCIADITRVFGPYGLLAKTVKHGATPETGHFPKPLPWLIYQTLCRGIELIMGCAMASITKQPSVSPRHQYLSSYPNYSARIKGGGNLYI